MGVRNYLIEGVSGTGKTSVCDELQRRGYQAIHGDRELAYQGDPQTGEPLATQGHEHHIWDIDKVKALVFDHTHAMTFFCGGSRHVPKANGAAAPPNANSSRACKHQRKTSRRTGSPLTRTARSRMSSTQS